MDGMTDARMEGWKARCMGTRLFGWMDGLNNTRIDGSLLDGHLHAWMQGGMDGC